MAAKTGYALGLVSASLKYLADKFSCKSLIVLSAIGFASALVLYNLNKKAREAAGSAA